MSVVCTVVAQWEGSGSAGAFLCSPCACVGSGSLVWLLLQSKASMLGYLLVINCVSPAVDGQPVKGVPCLSAHDSWDKLQICMDNFLYCMYMKPFELKYMILGYTSNIYLTFQVNKQPTWDHINSIISNQFILRMPKLTTVMHRFEVTVEK